MYVKPGICLFDSCVHMGQYELLFLCCGIAIFSHAEKERPRFLWKPKKNDKCLVIHNGDKVICLYDTVCFAEDVCVCVYYVT